MDDYSKAQWEAEQLALDRAREKEKRAQERKAKNALRKLRRIKDELDLSGDTTDWEAEFTESVTERLGEFGSAFADPTKGGYGEALSYAQKNVIAQMRRKAKKLKAEKRALETGEAPVDSTFKPRSGFRNKGSGFKRKGGDYKPRVRQLDEDFEEEPPEPSAPSKKVFIPEYTPETSKPQRKAPSKHKKPFLRIVKNDDS